MTSEQTVPRPVERRLSDALHAACVRRERDRRRQEQRRSRWLSQFEFERHHRLETRVEA